MFPARYWANRMFSLRYWPSVGAVSAVPPYRVAATQSFRAGATRGEAFCSGAAAAGSFRGGTVIGQGGA